MKKNKKTGREYFEEQKNQVQDMEGASEKIERQKVEIDEDAFIEEELPDF